MKELMSLFPAAEFEGVLPPIILRHQLYSLLSDRTQVDRQLVSHTHTHTNTHTNTHNPTPQLALRDCGKIRLFKLGVSEDQYCLVWTEDYRSHVETVMGKKNRLCEKFLKVVLPGNQEVSITRAQLKEEMKLNEEDITYVVSCTL